MNPENTKVFINELRSAFQDLARTFEVPAERLWDAALNYVFWINLAGAGMWLLSAAGLGLLTYKVLPWLKADSKYDEEDLGKVASCMVLIVFWIIMFTCLTLGGPETVSQILVPEIGVLKLLVGSQ